VDSSQVAENYQDDARWQLLASPHLRSGEPVSVAGYSDNSPVLRVQGGGHFGSLDRGLVRFDISDPGWGKSGGAVLESQGGLVALYVRQGGQGVGISIEEIEKQFTNWGFPWQLRPTNSGAKIQPSEISLSVGLAHSCRVAIGGVAYCWGDNQYGQLGTGDTSSGPKQRPVKMPSAVEFQEIAAGRDHTCALDTKGGVWCWGRNNAGQLGRPNIPNASVPLAVTIKSEMKSVTAGADFTCGINEDKRAVCWGTVGTRGYIPMAARASEYLPITVTEDIPFSQLSAGDHNVCGVAESKQVYCWGPPWTAFGDPPLGTETAIDFEAVSTSRIMGDGTLKPSQVCAISVDQDLYCWTLRGAPEHVLNKKVLSVAVRDRDLVAVTSQHELYLFSEPDSPYSETRRVPFDGEAATVTTGGKYWCMVDGHSEIFCWGSNSPGTGTGQQEKNTPTRILRP
jgi:hypothetical protein